MMLESPGLEQSQKQGGVKPGQWDSTTNKTKRHFMLKLFKICLIFLHTFLQVYCGEFKELQKLLCDLNFIHAKCQLGLGTQLMDDYQEKGQYTLLHDYMKDSFEQTTCKKIFLCILFFYCTLQ